MRRLLAADCFSYSAVKRALERKPGPKRAASLNLTAKPDPTIRAHHRVPSVLGNPLTVTHTEEEDHGHVYH